MYLICTYILTCKFVYMILLSICRYISEWLQIAIECDSSRQELYKL